MSAVVGTFLCPPGFAGPSGLRALAREGSALAEAARYLRRSTFGTGAAAPPGPDPDLLAPVVLVPGFLAGDGSLALMSRHLRGQGHRTYRSAIHANIGCSQRASLALERRVEEVAERRGRRVALVGHSLGGMMARGLAGRRPDLVREIVTLGSPILAPGAAHPLLLFDLKVLAGLHRAGLGALMGRDCTSGDCARASWEQTRVPLRRDVAFTSVFSRRDGIVDWRSCLDPAATQVEVTTSHVGMAFDPAVLDVVTRTLQSAGPDRRGRVSRPARWPAAPRASAGRPRAASR